jgi:predicted amidophosphoribosyltransferase
MKKNAPISDREENFTFYDIVNRKSTIVSVPLTKKDQLSLFNLQDAIAKEKSKLSKKPVEESKKYKGCKTVRKKTRKVTKNKVKKRNRLIKNSLSKSPIQKK